MDKEKVYYIIKYFSNFFNSEESKAHRHLMSLEKIGEADKNDKRFLVYKRVGWISSDENVLKLIKDGSDLFYQSLAEKIVNDNEGITFFNFCSKCGKLTRTPQARQCRYCGNKWFESKID